ncbi:MAG: flippase [Pseudomonadales bacterium]
MRDLGLGRLAWNAFGTFTRQVGAGLLSLASAAIIARFYGPESNGIYNLVLLLPGMLATFLSMGIGSANVFYVGSGQVSIRKATSVSLGLGGCLSVLGLMVGGLLVFWYGDLFFPGVKPVFLWISLVAFPLVLITGYIAAIFQGLQKFGIYNRLMLLQPSLFLLTVVVLYLSDISGLSYLVLGYVLTCLVTLIYALITVSLLAKTDKAPVGERYLRSLISYGWKSNVGAILGYANYRADIFLVNFFMSPVATGVYAISVLLVEKLWVLSSAISTVLLPRLAELSSDEAKRKELTPVISRFVFVFTLLAGLIVFMLSKHLVMTIFGADYGGSISPLVLLIPGVVLLGVAKVWANDLAARGRPELNMYTSFVTLIINVVGNVVLIPRYGLSGAAVATTLSYAVCSVITLYFYLSLSKNHWFKMFLPVYSDYLFLKQMYRREGI